MGHWLVDTAGIGSIVVLGVGLAVLAAYVYMLRWIQRAPSDPVPTEAESQDKASAAAKAGGEAA